jgi:CHASE3 domain sensor protein
MNMTAQEMFGKESVAIAVLSVGMVILIGFNVVSYQMLQHKRGHMDQVKYSRQIIDAARETLSAMKDVETGQRGYLLTGDPHYLEPFQTATKLIHAIRQLQVATAELKEKNAELEQFHDIVVGRELKMIDLEKQLRKLQSIPTDTNQPAI